ncbi:MAG: hypothetical protein Q9157_003830 [Trypethelium eluteriae]
MSAQKFRIREHVLPGQHIRHYPRSTANKQEDLIKFVIKQYIPLRNADPPEGSITILAAHANGFPKELYEPLWDELLDQSRHYGISIRSIWIADVSFQGASSVVNEGLLGNDHMLQMVNHFREEMPRPIVGIGHSMGGNNLVNLSLIHPRLLETIVLIDPVIQRYASMQGNYGPAQASSGRRDRWPSRAAAAAAFKRSKFYQSWDPRVLDLWVQHGLRELPTALYPDSSSEHSLKTSLEDTEPSRRTAGSEQKEVTLKTTKHMEVFTFMRPNWNVDPNGRTHPDVPVTDSQSSPFYRPEPLITFGQLPHLRPPVMYIFGSESAMSAPQLRADKLINTGTGIGGNGGIKAGNVKEVVFDKTGHLIPMEKVSETAQTCAEWLSERAGKGWQELERQEAEEWDRLSLREKTTMSEEFLAKIQGEDWLGKSKL